MKKIITLLLCFAMCFSFASCGNETPPEQPSNSSSSEELSSSAPTPQSSSSSVPESSIVENKEPYTYEIYPVKTWTNSIGTSYAQAVLGITNTSNYDIYLGNGDVELETYDGSLVDVGNYISAYPEIISPGETAFYFETIMLDSEPTEELYSVWDIQYAQSKVSKIQFPVTDVDISVDKFGYVKAMGRVENNTSTDQSLVLVSILLFDENNIPIGHMFTYIDIAANDKKAFECSLLNPAGNITLDSIAGYVAVAYPNQFNF